MIVFCGRCDTNPVDLSALGGVTAIDWAGMTAERPWCEWCIIWAIYQWPRIGIGVAAVVTKRQMRDADTCGMGDERPCPHGIRAGRYCCDCDNEGRYDDDASRLAHRFGPALGEAFDGTT